MKKSRIERLAAKDEKLVVKRILLLSFLSLILAIFLFTLGIPLLGKLADVADIIFKKKDTQTTNQAAPRPPRLDVLPTATNSAKLAISGFSDENTKVDIYLNDTKAGTTDVLDGKFKLDYILLKDGANTIAAQAINAFEKESEFSQNQIVVLDTEEPTLEVETPIDGQSFSENNRIKVFGKTDNDAQVYANGFLASIGSNNNFEVFVPLIEGENILEIKAIDEAGNIKLLSRKVSFHK